MIRVVSAVLALSLACVPELCAAQQPVTINGSVALASLVALSDNHIETVAGTLEMLASSPDVVAGNWSRIEAPLKRAASDNVPAIVFYANTGGTYWTSGGGKQATTLLDRAYFKRALSGKRTVGELVASRSTGKAVAVVAIPVLDRNGTVTGVLGASIYLDQLSLLLVKEMQLAPPMLFWAIDAQGTIALHSDPSNIFVRPAKISPVLARVTARMLAHDRGTETYDFRGKTRTIMYQRSTLTGWTYGFGIER
jgi:Cache domain